jgi:hypothetical protein
MNNDERQEAIERIRKLRMRTQSRGATLAEEQQAYTLATLLQRKYKIADVELEGSDLAERLAAIDRQFAKEQWLRFCAMEALVATPGWSDLIDYETLWARFSDAFFERRFTSSIFLGISGWDLLEASKRIWEQVSGVDLREMEDRAYELRLRMREQLKTFKRAARKEKRERKRALMEEKAAKRTRCQKVLFT